MSSDNKERHVGRFESRWLAFCLCVMLMPRMVAAYYVETGYRNPWYDTDIPTGWVSDAAPISTVFYGGQLADTNTIPSNTQYRLVKSSMGQPVPTALPDAYIGSMLTPSITNWALLYAYVDTNTATHAFYVPSTKEVIASYQGNALVHWVMHDGTNTVTNSQIYTISGSPVERPARIFWTQEPYRAPVIDISDIFVKIHHTPLVPEPTNNSVGNLDPGLWEDDLHMLRAMDCKGIVVLEYFETGAKTNQVGIQLVEVLPPQIRRQSVDIGTRLLPASSAYGDEGLNAAVTRGLLSEKAYKHDDDHSDMDGWVFATAKTVNEPWQLEVYWKQVGLQDIEWPYEVDWYSADWPLDAQIFVRGSSTNVGAEVLIPSDLGPQLQSYQEPDGHAVLGAQNAFSTTGEGYSLLKYATAAGVWFESVHSVYHDNTNELDIVSGDWEMGNEVRPVGKISKSYLEFNNGTASNVYIEPFEKGPSLTIECELFLKEPIPGFRNIVGDGESSSDFCWMLYGMAGSHLRFHVQEKWMWNSPNTIDLDLPDTLSTGRWYHVAAVCDNVAKVLRIYIDGELKANSASTYWGEPVNTDNAMYIGRDMRNVRSGPVLLDNVRIWDRALTQSDIQAVMFQELEGTETDLLAYYDFNSDEQDVVYDKTGHHDGTPTPGLIPQPYFDMTNTNVGSWMDFPGYVYRAEGDVYNVNIYDYPDTNDPSSASYVFGVNTNTLEVWWANPTPLASELPAVVYWPSRVMRYTNIWPTAPPRLVIAGQGTDLTGKLPADTYGSPELYVQDDPAVDGFNPNEEHAIVLGDQVYALRNDLNTEGYSEPYVFLQYSNNYSGRMDMRVYQVLQTDATYTFDYGPYEAGKLIQSPAPLPFLPDAVQTHNESPDSVWCDRNLDEWAVAAGDDGVSTTNVVMRYWYPMQAGFWFPGYSNGLPNGTEVPWLAGAVTQGTPVQVTYEIQWPTNAPELDMCDTLIDAEDGLPAIDGQKSVDLVYQQSLALGSTNSVYLIDPTRSRGATLTDLPEGISSQLKTDGAYYFPDLPPHLRERICYDPTYDVSERLRIKGEHVEPASGESYLLLNTLNHGTGSGDTNSDYYNVVSLSGADAAWSNAVSQLPQDPILITTNIMSFHSLALVAWPSGTGYVTVAFNNSTNLAEAGDPISVEIFKVVSNLYQGEVKVIESENPLDERLTLRHSGSFAGYPQEFEFEWRYEPPENDGSVPGPPYNAWVHDKTAVGALHNTIEGPGVKTLADHYYVCRYRPILLESVVSTNTWSEWAGPMLAEGWIKRAMSGINPFEQRISDFENYTVNTLVSMVSGAGTRWEGDIPLNLDNIDDYGLIEIYETILKRGRELSVDAIPPVNYGPANDALLFAAGRINDLYMVLANEAFADAADPTIGFGTDDGTYGAEASSLFCFMNQVDSLMDEELALLRGRDDTLLPSVQTAPYYNHLVWNFTRGIDGGEVAYALNYNVRDDQGDIDGFIDENDAAALYPQGHGDAWGHYLTAVKGYYGLLGNTNFTWIPRIEAVNVAGSTVNVDYYDERNFAFAAASKARTGSEIVNRTYRKNFEEDAETRWTGMTDAHSNRAWGVSEWACRADQGAFFDWVVGNSLLPYKDLDASHEGIQVVDRTTVVELDEIAANHREIQTQLDNANAELNPLGLARGVVPFDIDPAQVDRSHDNPKTHFEQVYDRALIALNNAMTVFNHAQGCTQLMRQQADSLFDFEITAAEQEIDYQSRLIEIFGYPYSDDIGPDKLYPDGYNGPDLIHFQYIDLYDLAGIQPTTTSFEVQLDGLVYEEDGFWRGWIDWLFDLVPGINLIWSAVDFGGEYYGTGRFETNYVMDVTYDVNEYGFIVKPTAYTGTRRAQGELQFAYGDFVQSFYQLERAVEEYNQLQNDIEALYALLITTLDANRSEIMWLTFDSNSRFIQVQMLTYLETSIKTKETLTEVLQAAQNGIAESTPTDVTDWLAPIRGAAKSIGDQIVFLFKKTNLPLKAFIKETERSLEYCADVNLELRLTEIEHEKEKAQLVYEMEQLINQQMVKVLDIQIQIQEMAQQGERYKQVAARALRLIDERTRFRKRTAEHVQAARYQDMAYRIFRNDSLQKYNATFDLAARYVYLAAKAYDYETCLIRGDDDATAGSDFLSQVVEARSLGRVADGVPQLAGSSGDPGLADIMARMDANWSVLKGRLGFNNPDTECNRFSLRSELFRIGHGAESDDTWRNQLRMCWKEDLYSEVPEFAEFCIPFNSPTGSEPGLVIEFGSEVEFAKNFFRLDLAGGDSAYDSTHFATKIRSVGVWFSNYDAVAQSGLANTPRVYLIPVGQDMLRSPTDNGGQAVAWEVVDQALPVPFPASQEDLDAYDWIPMHDTLGGGFAEIRKYPSLRAYHDGGTFDESETLSSSRLIGRSVWNTKWLLIIPGGTLLSDRDLGLETFIGEAGGTNGVKDIKLFFQTYSYSGN